MLEAVNVYLEANGRHRERHDRDITRIREDTGYEPKYDVERGVAEYVALLRAGNDRQTLS